MADALPAARGGRYSIARDRNRGERPVETDPVTLSFVFLATASPRRPLAQTPLSCQSCTNVSFLCPKGVTAPCSECSLGSPSPVKAPRTHGDPVRFVCFSPASLSLPVYFSDPARDLERVKENISPPYTSLQLPE